MSSQSPSPDPGDLDSLGPAESRRFWELIVSAGHHKAPTDFRITLECADAETAERVAAYLRVAPYQVVDVHKSDVDSDEAPFWEVVAHTGVRPLDEEYFLGLRQSIADTVRQFGCRFRSFS